MVAGPWVKSGPGHALAKNGDVRRSSRASAISSFMVRLWRAARIFRRSRTSGGRWAVMATVPSRLGGSGMDFSVCDKLRR